MGYFWRYISPGVAVDCNGHQVMPVAGTPSRCPGTGTFAYYVADRSDPIEVRVAHLEEALGLLLEELGHLTPLKEGAKIASKTAAKATKTTTRKK
jgi:hypothetical protein